MTVLAMVLGGLVLFAGGGGVAVCSLFATAGGWWVRLLGLAGAVLLLRGLGFGWVGVP